MSKISHIVWFFLFGSIIWSDFGLGRSGLVLASQLPDNPITHRMVNANGIQMHVAEAGCGNSSSAAILFLHGFPELWYSWRHQMVAVAAKGYCAIAPDLRGYGGTDRPAANDSYTLLHLVGDVVSLLDELGLSNVFVVGHDWGAYLAWQLCLMRSDKVKGLINSSIVFQPRNKQTGPVESYKAVFGPGFYICRFQNPGEAEAAFASVNTTTVIRTFMTKVQTEPIIIPVNKSIATYFEGPQTPLPSWLTQEDIDYYVSAFNKSGFTGGLNYYRDLDLSWELTAPWTSAVVKVPVMFMIGDEDMTYSFPGAKNFTEKKGTNKFVPLLEDVIVMNGVGHFLNQEKADEFNKHLLDFISKHKS